MRPMPRTLQSIFKFAIPSLITVGLFVACIFGIVIPSMEEAFVDHARNEARQLVQVVWQVLANYEHRVEAGELTREEAQKRAIRVIGTMRYGPDNRNYFFVSDRDLRTLVHPERPEDVGQRMFPRAPENLKGLFREMERIRAGTGEGFAEYWLQVPGQPNREVPKVSYMKVFRPWGWIVGTGIYVREVQARIRRIATTVITISAGILALVVVLEILLFWQGFNLDRQRLRALRALQTERDRYQQLVETMNEGIVVTRPDFTVTYVNDRLCHLLGYKREEILGHNLAEAATEHNHHIIREAMEKRREGLAIPYEIPLPRKDGRLVDVIVSPRFQYGPRGELTGILSVVTDISWRKRAERELEQAAEKYRRLFEGANDAIVLHSMTRIFDCNTKSREMLQASREDIVGSSPFRYFPEHQPDGSDSAEKGRRYLADALSGVPQFFEWHFRRDNGTTFMAEVSLTRIELEGETFIQSIIRDISARKQAERELHRLAATIQQSAQSVMITDPAGVVQYVNPAFEQCRGVDRERVIGVRYQELEEHLPVEVRRAFYRRKTADCAGWTGQVAVRGADGGELVMDTRIAPIYDPDGTIVHCVIFQRDITHEVRMERQLRQAQKMEAIGTLAGGIAHDFNNILGVIMGYSELAGQDMHDPEALSHDLEQVRAGAVRARDLVRQILAFSRQGDQQRVKVHLIPLVKETLKLLRASLPATIRIETELSADMDTLLADPSRLHQLILNLCTNAAHAMRERGGVLRVRLDNPDAIPAEGTDGVPATDRPRLRLVVQDTGHGMGIGVRDRIFEPFFTTKKPGEGTGMGLSVVHGIVTDLEGTIHVDSESGAGSTFTVLLPVTEEGPAAQAEAVEALVGGRERILLVDDEPHLVDNTRQRLEKLGYQVQTCVDSTAAAAVFLASAEEFDLVITDQTMPRLTGLELTERLREIRPDIPIILCTGFSEAIDPENIQEKGISRLLYKPVLLPDLACAIREALESVQSGRT